MKYFSVIKKHWGYSGMNLQNISQKKRVRDKTEHMVLSWNTSNKWIHRERKQVSAQIEVGMWDGGDVSIKRRVAF